MKRPEDMTREELEAEVDYLRGELGVQQDETRVERVKRVTGLKTQAVRMLLLLHDSAPRVVTKDFINETLFAGDPDPQIVTHHLSRIRAVLGQGAVGSAYGGRLRFTDLGKRMLAVLLDERAAA